jgi:hypothetical protein
VICNPNNPTGYLYSREEMDTLRELVIRHNLYLFSDEAYRDFCYSGTHISAINLKGAENNVLMMDTISKRYSACGGRIGALVTRNQAVLDTVMKFAQARLKPPVLRPDPRRSRHRPAAGLLRRDQGRIPQKKRHPRQTGSTASPASSAPIPAAPFMPWPACR